MKEMKQGNNVKEFGDFGKKWVGKNVTIVFSDGSAISGKISDNQKFFIEFTDSNNNTTFINKAHIREIILKE